MAEAGSSGDCRYSSGVRGLAGALGGLETVCIGAARMNVTLLVVGPGLLPTMEA